VGSLSPVTGLAVLATTLIVSFRGKTTGGQVGLAFYIIITIKSMLIQLLAEWTNLETSLGAISRIKELEKILKPEDKDGESSVLAKPWPLAGAIGFRNVTASYKYVQISSFSLAMHILILQSPDCCT
jgi:ATP-binding cassette subfamily C (CFTR/MRP) protein 1